MARARDERPGGDDGHEDHQDTGAPGARRDDGSEHRHATASDAQLTTLLRSTSPTAYTALRELRERHHPSVLAYARLCAASESAARELATQAFTVAAKETTRGIEPNVPWRHRLLLLTARVAGGWATGGGATGLAPALRAVLDTTGPGGRVPPLLAAFELLPPQPQGLIWYGVVEREPDDRTAVLLGLTPDDVTYQQESALRTLRQACLRVRLAASDDPRCQDFRRLIEESVRPDTPRHSVDLQAHMEHCPHCAGAYGESCALRDSPRATLAEGLLPWGGTAYTRGEAARRGEGAAGARDGTGEWDGAGAGSGFGFAAESDSGDGCDASGSGSGAAGGERAASGAGADNPGGASAGPEAWPGPGVDDVGGSEAWVGADAYAADAGAVGGSAGGAEAWDDARSDAGSDARVGRSAGKSRAPRASRTSRAPGAKGSSSRRVALTSVALGAALAPLLAILVLSGSGGSSSDDEAGSGGAPAVPPSGAVTPTVPPSPTLSPTPSETTSPSKPPRKEKPTKSPSRSPSPSPSTSGPLKPSLPYGPPLNGAYTQVVNVASGLCLDIRGELAQGTDVVTATCSTRATQRWRLDSHLDVLQSFADPDLCLDSRGATDDGVGVADCDALDGNHGDNLRFEVDSRGAIRPAVAPGYAVAPDALGSVSFAEASGRDGQRWRAGAGPVHD